MGSFNMNGFTPFFYQVRSNQNFSAYAFQRPSNQWEFGNWGGGQNSYNSNQFSSFENILFPILNQLLSSLLHNSTPVQTTTTTTTTGGMTNTDPPPNPASAFPVSNPSTFSHVSRLYGSANSQSRTSLISSMLQNVTQPAIANAGSNLTSTDKSNIQTQINQLVENSASDTTPLDEYEPGELAFDARLASHEQQADGAQEPNGVQGTIFLQTLLNGTNNGQASTFLNTAQRQDWFVRAMLRSYNTQTQQLNGNGLKDAVGDSYLQGTGVSIQSELNQVPTQTADDSASTVFKQFADPTQSNYVSLLQQQSGWSDQQIMADALWGHDQFENLQVTNANTTPFLQDAYSDTSNQQDYPLVHLNSTTEAYTQNLLNSATPGTQLDQDFLNVQAQAFGNKNIADPTQAG